MPPTTSFQIANIRFGSNAPLFLIAGPCVIETEAHATRMAECVGAVAAELGIPYIFKPLTTRPIAPPSPLSAAHN